MSYIPFIIAILILITLIASGSIAFITQKNWATVTLITGLFLLIGLIATSIYFISSETHLLAINNGTDQSRIDKYQYIMTTLSYIAPLFIVTGIIGFIYTSRSIFEKSTQLQLENSSLADKLNQP